MASVNQRQKRNCSRRRRLKNVSVHEISLVDNPAVPSATFLIAKRGEDEAVPDEVEDKDEEKQDAEVAKDEAAGDGPPADKDEQAVAKDGDEPAVSVEPVADVEKAASVVAAAFVTAIQALRSVANQLPPSGLHQLASLMEFAGGMYWEDESVQAELQKCDNEVLPHIAEIVEKAKQAKAQLAKVDEPAPPAEKEPVAEEPAPAPEPPAPEPPAPEPVAKVEEPRSVLEEAAELLAKRRAEREAVKINELEAKVLQKVSGLATRMEENLNRAVSLGKRLDKAMGKAS